MKAAWANFLTDDCLIWTRQFYRLFQVLLSVERRKCPAFPASQNRTPKTIASTAYGPWATLSQPLLRFDGGLGHTGIVRWTAGIRDGSRIWSRKTRLASAAISDFLALCLWRTASENIPSGSSFFFSMTRFPAFQYHVTILSYAIFHNLGPFFGRAKK